MRYERPVPTQGLVWTTDVGFERNDDRLRGFARLYQRSLGSGRPRFERVVLRPPSFLWHLRNLGLFGPAKFSVRTISQPDVGQLLEDIFDPLRTYLIVAVSVHPYSEKSLLDPSQLQDDLIGIAQVVELRKLASLALPREFERRGVPRELGKKWGAYGGAVKVYRTPASPSDSPFDHPIWLPTDVDTPGFPATLKDWCWSLATLQTQIQVPDVTSIRETRRSLQTPQAPPGLSVDELTELYQAYLSEEQARTAEEKRRADLEKERADELAQKVRELEAKIQALKFQLDRKYEAAAGPSDEPDPAQFINVADAIDRARKDVGSTLLIPDNVVVDTDLSGDFWYGALRALHELAEMERQGAAKHKRALLRDLLHRTIGTPKDTYKVADTGVYITHPETGARIHLRERVHLREGKPGETESIYWQTAGSDQRSYRYLIGRIGRHA